MLTFVSDFLLGENKNNELTDPEGRFPVELSNRYTNIIPISCGNIGYTKKSNTCNNHGVYNIFGGI